MLIAAFLLGVVAGLRTFTAPAVLWLIRHGGPAAYVLGAGALLEYAADLYPKTPPRTAAPGLIGRLISGAFCGWAVTGGKSAVGGALLGAGGALIGAYGGLEIRSRAIALIGPVPAAIVEDVIAIALAVGVVLALAP